MGDPKVTAKFLGDTTGLEKSTKQVVNLTTKIGGAFTDLGSRIGGEMGSLVSDVGDAFTKVGTAGTKMSTKFVAAGAAAIGLGLALKALGSSDAQAQAQLKASIEATGGSWDEYEKQVEAAIKAGENFGITADHTQNALNTLVTATGDPAKAFKYLALVENLAAAQHISLEDAAAKVGRVLDGNTKLLKQYNIVTDASKDKTAQLTDGLTQLSARLSGQAKASVSGFTGQVDVIKAKVTDFASALAGPVGAGLQGFGAGLALVGTIMESKFLGKLKKGVSEAEGFGGKLKAGLGAVGPWAIGLTLAAGAVGLFLAKSAKSQQRINDLTNAIVQDSGAVGQNTRAYVANQFAQDGTFKAAHQLGISVNTVTEAALGNKAAIDEVNGATQQYATIGLTGAHSELGKNHEATLTLTQSIGDMSTATNDAFSAAQDFTTATGEQTSATEAATGATKDASGAIADYSSNLVKAKTTLLDYYQAVEAKTLATYDAIDADKTAKDQIKALGKQHKVTATDIEGLARQAYAAADAQIAAGKGAGSYRDELVHLRDYAKKGSPAWNALQDLINQLDKAAKARTIAISLEILNKIGNKSGIPGKTGHAHGSTNGVPWAAGGMLGGSRAMASGGSWSMYEHGYEAISISPNGQAMVTPHSGSMGGSSGSVHLHFHGVFLSSSREIARAVSKAFDDTVPSGLVKKPVSLRR